MALLNQNNLSKIKFTRAMVQQEYASAHFDHVIGKGETTARVISAWVTQLHNIFVTHAVNFFLFKSYLVIVLLTTKAKINMIPRGTAFLFCIKEKQKTKHITSMKRKILKKRGGREVVFTWKSSIRRSIWDKKVNKSRPWISPTVQMRHLFEEFYITERQLLRNLKQHWKFLFLSKAMLLKGTVRS